MGDRTYLQGVVYALNGADPEAVLELFDAYSINGTQYDEEPWSVATLEAIPDTGLRFDATEVSVGTARDIAGDLENASSDGVTFMMWEDPRYEWLGELFLHHPELGSYEGTCDSDGNSLLTDYQFRQMVEGLKPKKALAALDEELGVTYQTNFANLVNLTKKDTT
jgi:hypothetical protein